jgi:S1-C subfamily serine protease
MHNNASYTARVVGGDRAKDIAVLKLSIPKHKAEQLQPVTLGTSAALRVGQSVFTLGNPFGLDHTLNQVCVLGGVGWRGTWPGLAWPGLAWPAAHARPGGRGSAA